MKKLFVFILSLASINIFGETYVTYSTQIGDIYYTLNSYLSTATVSWLYQVWGPGGESWHAPIYQGDIAIPEEVVFEGHVYQVKNIDLHAFNACKYKENALESLTIPASITSIHGEAIVSEGNELCLKKMSIPSWDWWFEIAPTRKGRYSHFWALDEVDDFIGVADHLFVGGVECDLSNFVFPQDKTIVPRNTFRAVKKLKQITLPNTLKAIGDYAFYNAGLTSIEIPSGVDSIGEMAFALCTEIKEIVIPDQVRHLGTGVFCGCMNLSSLTIGRNWDQQNSLFDGIYPGGGTPPLKVIVSKITEPINFNPNFFDYYIYNEATLYVPIGTKDAYLQCEGWNRFKNIVEGEPDDTQYTGIVVPKDKKQDTRVFTLDGKVVKDKIMKPGVYIKNGKKYISN
jgi:hypothetical protein